VTDSILFDRAVNVLHKALNISSDRQRVVASNIANVDTVGYKPTDIDFKKTLVNALETPQTFNLTHTHQNHIQQSGADNKSYVLEVDQSQSREAVDIDREMTHLAENNLQYRTNLEMMLRKIGTIRYSITGGGR
jgi:flagellar basal-body rod protein FlgB